MLYCFSNKIELDAFCTTLLLTVNFKPGLHEPQLPIGRSVTIVSPTVVERRRWTLQVSSVARLQENKETWRSIQLAVVDRINLASV